VRSSRVLSPLPVLISWPLFVTLSTDNPSPKVAYYSVLVRLMIPNRQQGRGDSEVGFIEEFHWFVLILRGISVAMFALLDLTAFTRTY
jgi:hypothetical protein